MPGWGSSFRVNQDPHKYREGKADFILQSIDSIKQSIKKINDLKGSLNEKRGTVMGIEGSSGKIYFNTVNKIMPRKYKFKGRSRMPAKDPFNAMLNYGYGILYSMVEKACIIAGLDPYVGFIHTDNYNKKSLVFDIIEMFRTYMDHSIRGDGISLLPEVYLFYEMPPDTTKRRAAL